VVKPFNEFASIAILHSRTTSVSVQHAFEAHSRPTPLANPPAQSSVLAIGNAGALGEAVLARILASHRYRDVAVATTQAMHTSAPRLNSTDYRALFAPAAWKEIAGGTATDAVILIGGKHSFLRRDDAFPVVSTEDAIALARAARGAGVTRLLVVAPMDAWSAMTLGSLAHFDELERALVPLEFPTLIIVRPSAHREKESSGGALNAIARGLLGTLSHYMTTASRQPLRARMVAEAVVEWLTQLPPGLHRQDAVSLHAWVEAKQAARTAASAER
jgi:hypothetical protein